MKLMLRQELEALEQEILSPHAAKSGQSRGRQLPEEPCEVRTEFQRDRDRIIHSKAFRRLKHKTQVFIAPEGDHYRTRLTHTLEVSQIARTVARALRLNEDLTEAIALGHDLGHTPFGHAGEDALNDVFPGGFRHNQQSLRVVEKLEQGTGLNLTWEVRDGIVHHTGDGRPATMEGQIVRIADRIAYINHDIDDAIRGGIITAAELPQDSLGSLGERHRERINSMVLDMVHSSYGQREIMMTPTVQQAMDELRTFMFNRVYIGSRAKEEEGKAKRLVRALYHHYTANPGDLPPDRERLVAAEGPDLAVCDYIAGMTDNFAIALYQSLFVPRGFRD